MNNGTEQIFLLNAAPNQSSAPTQRMGAIAPPPSSTQVNLDNVEDFSHVCRICATITELVMPILSGEGLQNKLGSKIRKHLPITVRERDELPLVVCYQCANTLLAWHELVKCCVQADLALHAKIAANKRKTNPPNNVTLKSSAIVQEEPQDKYIPEISPPARQPFRMCVYCASSLPVAKYREHLVVNHYKLLFHCKDCDDLVDRRELRQHLSFHDRHLQYRKKKAHNNNQAPTPAPTNIVPKCSPKIVSPGPQGNTPVSVKIETPVPVKINTQVPVKINTPVPDKIDTRVPVKINTPVPVKINTPLPVNINTPVPVKINTSLPVNINIPVPVKINTPLPVNINTPVPVKINAPVPVKINTPLPVNINTPVPGKINAPLPVKINTPVSVKINTPVPDKIETPEPVKINTQVPVKINTPVRDKIDTPVPVKINTPLPVNINTPVPGKINAPLPVKINTPVPVKITTPVPVKINTPVSVKINTPVPVKIDTPVPVKIDTPVSFAIDKTSVQENEFSDHSDTEGFGPLPESVFDAIEDSQDGQQLTQPAGTTNHTPETERPKDEYIKSDAPQNNNLTNPSICLENNNYMNNCSVVIEPMKIENCVQLNIATRNRSVMNILVPPENEILPKTAEVNNKQSTDEKGKKNQKTRKCPFCPKEYRASSSYFYHLKHSHEGAKEHECEVCGRKVYSKSSLTQHMTIHTSHYDYECSQCEKHFRSKAGLYTHEQTHKGLKSFSCNHCDTSFRWRTHLIRHMARHSAERAHVCGACGRGFSVRYDLLRHARTHSAGNFACDKCGRKFAQLRYLKVHTTKQHARHSRTFSK